MDLKKIMMNKAVEPDDIKTNGEIINYGVNLWKSVWANAWETYYGVNLFIKTNGEIIYLLQLIERYTAGKKNMLIIFIDWEKSNDKAKVLSMSSTNKLVPLKYIILISLITCMGV